MLQGVNSRDVYQLFDVLSAQIRGFDGHRRRCIDGAVSGAAPVVTAPVFVKRLGWIGAHGVASNAVVEMSSILVNRAVGLRLKTSL